MRVRVVCSFGGGGLYDRFFSKYNIIVVITEEAYTSVAFNTFSHLPSFDSMVKPDTIRVHSKPACQPWNLRCYTAHAQLLSRSWTDAAHHTASPHSFSLHSVKGASLHCSAAWVLIILRFAFLVFRKQAALTSTWHTRKRNPKRRGRAGKILSTTRGRGNSWGALHPVGVRNTSSETLLRRVI